MSRRKTDPQMFALVPTLSVDKDPPIADLSSHPSWGHVDVSHDYDNRQH